MENVQIEPESSKGKAERLFDQTVIEHTKIENVEATASYVENTVKQFEVKTIFGDVEPGDTKILPRPKNFQKDVLKNIEIIKNLNATSSTDENNVENVKHKTNFIAEGQLRLNEISTDIQIPKLDDVKKQFLSKKEVAENEESEKGSNATATNNKNAEEYFHNESNSLVVKNAEKQPVFQTNISRNPEIKVGSKIVENKANAVEADVCKDKSNKIEESISLSYAKLNSTTKRLFKIALSKGHTREESIKLAKSTDFFYLMSKEKNLTKESAVEHFDGKNKRSESKGLTIENVTAPTCDIKNPQTPLDTSELVKSRKKRKTRRSTTFINMNKGQKRRFNLAMQDGCTREQAIEAAMTADDYKGIINKSGAVKKDVIPSDIHTITPNSNIIIEGEQKSIHNVQSTTKNTEILQKCESETQLSSGYFVQENILDQTVKKDIMPNHNESNNKHILCNEHKDSAFKRFKMSSTNSSITSQKNPHSNLVHGHFPYSEKYTNQKVLTFLGAQNNLKTDMWKVVKRRSGTTLLTLHFQVDDDSWTQLTKVDGMVSYRFSELKLIMNEGPSTSVADTSKHMPTSQNDVQGKEPQRKQHRSMAAYENNEEL